MATASTYRHPGIIGSFLHNKANLIGSVHPWLPAGQYGGAIVLLPRRSVSLKSKSKSPQVPSLGPFQSLPMPPPPPPPERNSGLLHVCTRSRQHKAPEENASSVA